MFAGSQHHPAHQERKDNVPCSQRPAHSVPRSAISDSGPDVPSLRYCTSAVSPVGGVGKDVDWVAISKAPGDNDAERKIPSKSVLGVHGLGPPERQIVEPALIPVLSDLR